MNSFWIDTYPNILDKSKTLDKNLETDVCIIGGGITGTSIAYNLCKKGFNVTILEKDKIAMKTTGHTTAKVTSQHNLFYKYLSDTISNSFAKDYFLANQEAIINIKNIIDENNINCDFEYQDSYVFTTSENDIQKIKDETQVVNSFDFNAEYLDNIPLNISNMLGAIKFPNQAQFNPRKYINGLCNFIINNSGEIFEDSMVYDIKRNGNKYFTYTKNNTVTSKYLILASHYPIKNFPGYYFLKMYKQTSNVIAIETKEILCDGMYISSNSPTISFRTVPFNNKRISLISGFGHKTGAKIDLSYSYSFLENEAKKLYPDAKVLYKWNTQDCISLDKIPYIGDFSNLLPNMYVATGFKKWGMTTSNIASNIITDKILQKENKYEYIFKSTRFNPIKNKTEFGNILKETTHSLILNKFDLPTATIDDINNDEGKIVTINKTKVGVYKDKDGNVFKIKPVCSHLGCELSWNNLDKTWDCPCHGSRFDYKGNSIYSPSIKNLELFE